MSFFDDVAIEQLKSELAVAAAQRKVEFSHLHSKRPEVLAQVHADLRDAADAMADYTKAFEPVGVPHGERRQWRRQTSLFRTFRTNEIYLPEPAAEKVGAIADELKFAFFQLLYGVGLGGDMGTEKATKWLAIQEEVERLSGPATKELQKDFRTLLGYQTPVPNPANWSRSKLGPVTKLVGEQRLPPLFLFGGALLLFLSLKFKATAHR